MVHYFVHIAQLRVSTTPITILDRRVHIQLLIREIYSLW